VVGPDRTGIHSLHPGSKCTRVRAAREDPRNILGIAVRVASERQVDLVGEVCQVVDGVLQGEVFEVLGRQVRERRGSAPVAVLQDNGRSSDLLGDDSGGAVGAEVAGVAGGVDLAGGKEDDWRAWKGLSVLASCRCCGRGSTHPAPSRRLCRKSRTARTCPDPCCCDQYTARRWHCPCPGGAPSLCLANGPWCAIRSSHYGGEQRLPPRRPARPKGSPS
jgi:hypothetical protein